METGRAGVRWKALSKLAPIVALHPLQHLGGGFRQQHERPIAFKIESGQKDRLKAVTKIRQLSQGVQFQGYCFFKLGGEFRWGGVVMRK